MIEILKIAESSPFPIIDFKFQNRGSATAFLWKFTVRVLSLEIDRTPVPRHFLGIAPLKTNSSKDENKISLFDNIEGMLTVATRNDGWGPALNCEISVSESSLNSLFAESVRSFRENIESGQNLTILSLDPSTANPESLAKALKKQSEDSKASRLRVIHGWDHIPRDYLSLEIPKIRSTFQDIYGISHEDVQYASTARLPGNFEGRLYLDRDSFKWHGDRVCFAPFASSAVYYVSLDPEMQTSQRSYSISHKIPSGDIERFHLMIGSSKSCKAVLRFEFSIDSEHNIISEEFYVKISNPMNSNFSNPMNSNFGYRYTYRDGDELLTLQKRSTSKQQVDVPEYKEFYRRRQLWEELDKFNRSKFPFLNE